MKKSMFFLIPIVIFLLFSLLGNRLLLSGSVSPTTFVLIAAGAMLLMVVIRPKGNNARTSTDAALEVLGDFAKDAFAKDPQSSGKFQTALNDYAGNCPKAAISKLAKLAPQCSTDADTYAVSVLTALCHCTLGNYEEAIREYNKAIVRHPTSALAVTIGSCHQRLGQLHQAKDSYEFALELDAGNLEARSGLATAYVADGDYETALEQAMLALNQDEKLTSALATAAICYGVQEDTLLYKHYTSQAVENGYSEEKIKNTVSALKKRR